MKANDKDRIKLSEENKKALILKIKQFFSEERDEDIGLLSASIYLDFIMENIAPIIYNQGIDDAEFFLRNKIEDMCLLRIE